MQFLLLFYFVAEKSISIIESNDHARERVLRGLKGNYKWYWLKLQAQVTCVYEDNNNKRNDYVNELKSRWPGSPLSTKCQFHLRS